MRIDTFPVAFRSQQNTKSLAFFPEFCNLDKCTVCVCVSEHTLEHSRSNVCSTSATDQPLAKRMEGGGRKVRGKGKWRRREGLGGRTEEGEDSEEGGRRSSLILSPSLFRVSSLRAQVIDASSAVV